MPGSSTLAGFGTTTRSAKLPVDGSTVTSENASLPVMLEWRAVLEQDPDRQVARAFEGACCQCTTQFEQLGGRLRHVDVHRIELLHGRERGGLVGGDERALRDRRLADPSADGRGDARVAQHDISPRHGGSRRLDVGFGLAQRGGGVFVLLLADRVDLQQLRAAARVELGRHQRGFGPGEARRGALAVRAIGGVFDLVQRLAGLDQAAFGEQPARDDAVDLGPDLGDQEGRHATRQFALQRHRLRRQRHDRHGRRRHGLRAARPAGCSRRLRAHKLQQKLSNSMICEDSWSACGRRGTTAGSRGEREGGENERSFSACQTPGTDLRVSHGPRPQPNENGRWNRFHRPSVSGNSSS